MGVDIHVKIAKRNAETGLWESLELYRKDKNTPIDCYPYRNYELFDGLRSFPAAHGIEIKFCEPKLKKEIEDCQDGYYYGFSEINLADFKYYLSVNEPDEDPDEKEQLIAFENIIESYLNFADPCWSFDKIYSNYKIIYWFDN